jgi:hypothetical protein
MSRQNLLAASLFVSACVIGVAVSLSQQAPPAPPAQPSPSSAARSVLENMEITPEGGVNFYSIFKAGQFVVASDNSRSAQKFFWEVKALRADVAPLQAEP